MKVESLVIGTAFMDIKGFSKGKYDPIGRNVGKIEYFHGGVARNIAENMANIGMSVSFLSMADKNSTGDAVITRLEAAGVNTEYMLRCDHSGNGVWLAIMDETGELAGSISQTPDFSALERHLNSVGENAAKNCSSIVLEIDLNAQIAQSALELGQRAGVPIYAVVGNMSVVLAHPEYLKMTDCFICNEIEAGKLFGKNLINANREDILLTAKVGANALEIPSIVVTMGKNGAVYYDAKSGQCGWQPALETQAVDTTGAGDAFFSGAVSALTRGYSIDRAAYFGASLASKVIGWRENSCPVITNFFE